MKDKEALWLLGFTVLLLVIVWALSPTIINRADAQHKAEQDAIELHKQEIKHTSNKEVL